MQQQPYNNHKLPKSSTGSYLPTGILWPVHHNSMFAGSKVGTVDTGFALHASHQLYGKVLRYLKKVIVTSSLHRCLGPLKRALTCRQWEGLRNRTCPCGLAIPFVFIKQSSISSQCPLVVPKRTRDPLYRRYGANLPNSLTLVLTLHALGFSPRGTSVGSWYDFNRSLNRSFSWTLGVN